jgi:hypothetical protein
MKTFYNWLKRLFCRCDGTLVEDVTHFRYRKTNETGIRKYHYLRCSVCGRWWELEWHYTINEYFPHETWTWRRIKKVVDGQ